MNFDGVLYSLPSKMNVDLVIALKFFLYRDLAFDFVYLSNHIATMLIFLEKLF